MWFRLRSLQLLVIPEATKQGGTCVQGCENSQTGVEHRDWAGGNTGSEIKEGVKVLEFILREMMNPLRNFRQTSG